MTLNGPSHALNCRKDASCGAQYKNLSNDIDPYYQRYEGRGSALDS